MLKYYVQGIVLGTTYKNEFPFPLRRTIKVRDFRVWGIWGFCLWQWAVVNGHSSALAKWSASLWWVKHSTTFLDWSLGWTSRLPLRRWIKHQSARGLELSGVWLSVSCRPEISKLIKRKRTCWERKKIRNVKEVFVSLVCRKEWIQNGSPRKEGNLTPSSWGNAFQIETSYFFSLLFINLFVWKVLKRFRFFQSVVN